LLPFTPHKNAALRRVARGGGRLFILLELLRLLPADGFRGRRRLFRFQAGRDRFGLRAPLPPRRPLLAITLHIGLTRLGRVRRAFSFFARRGLTQGHLPPGFSDHIRDRARDQGDRANRVVVSWNRNGDQVGIGIRIYDRDHRNPELVRLGDGDPFLLGVHHEQRARQPAQVLDAREILVQLAAFAVEEQLLLLRVIREVAIRRTLFQILEPVICFLIVWKFVSVPPSQRSVT